MTGKELPLSLRLVRRIIRNSGYLLRRDLGKQADEARYALEEEAKRYQTALVEERRLRGQLEAELRKTEAALREAEAKGRGRDAQLKTMGPRLAQLDHEVLCMLRTGYGADPWFEQSKDLHKGARCFLLGCGPSLNQVDLSKLRGEHVMGVNGTYLLEQVELDYFISVSRIFWQHHADTLPGVRCKRAFLPPYVEVEMASPVSWLRCVDEKAYARVGDKPWLFSTCADRYVVLGGSVLAVGLQILYHLGFTEVITLGLDHDYGLSAEENAQRGFYKPSKELDAHFLPDYYKPQGADVFIDMLAAERCYRLALEAFERDGRRIRNASPGTKLDILPTVDFDSLFET